MSMDGTPIIIKKKKVAAHAHHGGSWKVAYADFVTSMMAFFLVLWIMGLSDSTRTQVAGYFNDPLGYSKTEPMSRNIIPLKSFASPRPGESKQPGSQSATGTSQLQEALKRLKSKSAGSKAASMLANAALTWNHGEIRLEFVESKGTFFFEVGSATLTPDAKQIVKGLAPTLTKLDQQMSFEGHTDSRQYGAGGYDNLDLSQDRARALKNELKADGVPQKLFGQVVGFGDSELKIPNDPYAPENRRVAILIHPVRMSGQNKPDLLGDNFKPDIKPQFRPDDPSVRPTAPKIADK